MGLKSSEEIEVMARGGRVLASILDELETEIRPGVTGKQLDDITQTRMQEAGVTPAFLGYAPGGHEPYPAALCVSVNNAVVHGIPHDRPFEQGDVVGIDAGLIYEGMYLDSARTVLVEPVSEEVRHLVDVTKRSLELGIAQARVGKTTGDIGHAIQQYAEAQGFQVVRQLVGHGVGHDVHEEPQVPNFGKPGTGVDLEEGLVIAIEPMVTIGNPNVTTAHDGWTIVTESGAIAAHQEHTVAVTMDGPRILTSSTRVS